MNEARSHVPAIDRAAAAALIKFMTSPAAIAVLKAKGLSPG